jgi:Glycosyl hydrolases family 2
MTNRILDVEIRTQRLSPAEAEVWVIVTAAQTTAGTSMRGRFVGPKCKLASTIEVAYPLLPFPHKPPDLPGLAARVVIPEPNYWEPECPFVYDCVIELWQDEERCDVRRLPGYKLLKCNLR